MRGVIRNRALGVTFILLLATGVWLVNAVFTQRFVSFDRVNLNTDHIGLQLPSKADVKVRGEIVGQVLSTTTRSGGARMVLGIKPDKIGSIPANVTASIIPKTLFGEKYVSLDIPTAPSSAALKTGDLIPQTKLPIEVEKVLNDIYPLLRTVQPAEISYTLNALATALEGRGDKIGNNLEVINSYLTRLNPKVPALVEDLKLLGTVSATYADVLPQIASTLRNSITTSQTLQGRQARLNAFLKDTTAFSNTAKGFLDTNGDNIVRLGQVSEPTLDLLKRYSPEFPCMLQGIVNQAPKLGQTFRGYIFHIVARTIPQQPRGYNAGDTPVFGASTAPYCGTLPNPPYSPKNPKTSIPDFNDGVAGQLSRTATSSSYGATVSGTPQDKAVMTSLAAPVLQVPADQVGDLTTLLFGPIAKGSEISMQGGAG